MPNFLQKFSPQQFGLVLFSLVAGIAGFFYMILGKHALLNTAVLYVGLPTIIAIFVGAAPRSQSATGTIIRVMIVLLLGSGPILGEGYLCILFTLPIWLIPAFVIGSMIDTVKTPSNFNENSFKTPAAIIFLALLSLEGTTEPLTINRNHSIQVEKIVATTPAMVQLALSQTPEKELSLPLFLRLFPSPLGFEGEGLDIGDTRTVHLVLPLFYKERRGKINFRITAKGDHWIQFTPVSDDSYMSHYLEWKRSTVRWEPRGTKQTKITWELDFQRKLDPSWYFGPLQSYAATLAAEALIDNVATPRS